MVTIKTKAWYESRTLWLAILQGLASVLAILMASPEFQAVGWLGLVKTLVDGYLRVSTTRSII